MTKKRTLSLSVTVKDIGTRHGPANESVNPAAADLLAAGETGCSEIGALSRACGSLAIAAHACLG